MRIYIVQPNDSVDEIASSQNVSAQSIIYDNQLVYPYALAVGQALLLTEPGEEDLGSPDSGSSNPPDTSAYPRFAAPRRPWRRRPDGY